MSAQEFSNLTVTLIRIFNELANLRRTLWEQKCARISHSISTQKLWRNPYQENATVATKGTRGLK